MRRGLVVGLIAAGILAAAGPFAWAEEDKNNPGLLAKALAEASVPLERGLKASAREGTPISAKYELADGALQLSVYTMSGAKFTEVIVDHKSGAVKKAEPITEGDDLKEATAESQAMAQAKLPLDKATDEAIKANSGYRAVSVTPMLKDGHPVADVTLIKGKALKEVTEKLD